ncbi:hypothetical protein Gpo141_00009317 [Globisporangium polare]
MASALAAFAYGLGSKEKESSKAKVDDNDAQVVDSDADDEAALQEPQVAARPKSLVDVAQMSNSKPAQAAGSLADFALQQKQQPAALSLLQVAQQENRQQLSAIAAQLSQEDTELNKQRSEKIQNALQATSEQVRAQAQAKQRQAIEQAVQRAIVEEQQYQQDDGFEDEDDQAIHQAANLLIAKASAASVSSSSNTNPPNDKDPTKPAALALSVDRHVLKQRQNRHGLQSKSTSKAKTMKDKLSSFQFHQLSIMQRRLFLATLVDDDAGDNHNAAMENGKKKSKYNKDAINELAKDKAKLQKQKQHRKPEFAKLDDNRNCRFKPRFFTGGQQSEKKAKQNGSDDDDDNNNNANQRSEDFVRRMEAAERAKNEQLRRTREEMAYLARVDKKECPMCGNPQSYSELSQKRKKCPNCGVTYKNRVAWSDIANQFLERMEQFLDMKDEARRKREEQQLQAISDGHHHRHHHHQRRSSAGLRYGDNNADADDETKTWEEVQDEFLGRVQLDLMHRALSKDAILHELQRECSFTPSISTKAKRLNLGTFDERLRRDLENRKARQEQYRVLAGAIAAASGSAGIREGDVRETRLANKSKRLQGLPPPANFQERLRLDLEKRREREQDNNLGAKQRARRPTQTQIKW